MNACARFEQEGLLAVESGQDLDPHYDDCPDCRSARSELRRLGEAIGEAGAADRPRGDWQARVWSEVRRSEEKSTKKSAWRRPWTLVPVGLAAALIAAVLVVPRSAGTPELIASVEAGAGPVRRGTEAHPGDVLVLEAKTGGLANAELRVYFNDREVVFSCAGEPPCERRGNRLRASFVLESIGSYQPVFLVSDEPLPAPGQGLDADAGAAMRAGVVVELPGAIDVR